MRFYTKQHQFYGGIDLHARTMYVCILNQGGEIMLHRNMKTSPEMLLRNIAPYRADIVVAVECMVSVHLHDSATQRGTSIVRSQWEWDARKGQAHRAAPPRTSLSDSRGHDGVAA